MIKRNRKEETPKDGSARKRVIRLDDLDWTEDVVGGSAGKMVFGESVGEGDSFESFLDSGSAKKDPRSL